MNICLFTPEEVNKPIPPHDERAEHIIKILHKKCGDSFTAGIIGGKAGTAVITSIVPKGTPDAGSINFSFTPENDGKPLYPLTLIVGFPRPIQLRRLFRDAAGLGVKEIHLTGTELGEKSYMQSSLIESGSAYKMLMDGTAQAGGTHIPDIHTHINLQDCLKVAAAKNTILIAPDNIRPSVSITDFLSKNRPVTPEKIPIPVIAAIGSERGWTNTERELLERYGFIRCSMGTRILRTETAATVAASLILSAMQVI